MHGVNDPRPRLLRRPPRPHRRRTRRSLALLLLAACSRQADGRRADGRDSADGARSTLTLTSPAFHEGASIPPRFTCDGADRSPPLAWSGAPPETGSYALLVEDPDAPGGTFVHWVIYDLPRAATALPEGVPAGASLPRLGGARQGRNDFGGPPGYRGPCPPPGPAHHYHFRLFALDRRLNVEPGASRDQVAAAMHGHELARAELVGTYARRR